MRALAAFFFAASLLTASVAGQSQCVTDGVFIVVARGTDEPPGNGKEEIFVDYLKATIPGSNSTSVNYPANATIPASPDLGLADIREQITDYADACPDSKMVLMGYSQGAHIVANAVSGGGVKLARLRAATTATPPLPREIMSKVVSIIVFGDPNFIADQSYDLNGCTTSSKIPRNGSQALTWNSYSPILQSYCASGDLVCCGTGTSVAAHISYFNPTNAQSVVSFVQSNLAMNRDGSVGKIVTSTMNSNPAPTQTTPDPQNTDADASSTDEPNSAALRTTASSGVLGGLLGLFLLPYYIVLNG